MKLDKDWLHEWNELHCKYVKEEMENCYSDVKDDFHRYWPREKMVGHRNSKMADYCEKMIIKAKETYYNTGESIMSDQIYDSLERKLKILKPESKVLEKVGT